MKYRDLREWLKAHRAEYVGQYVALGLSATPLATAPTYDEFTRKMEAIPLEQRWRALDVFLVTKEGTP